MTFETTTSNGKTFTVTYNQAMGYVKRGLEGKETHLLLEQQVMDWVERLEAAPEHQGILLWLTLSGDTVKLTRDEKLQLISMLWNALDNYATILNGN